jgi:hypothetical protein
MPSEEILLPSRAAARERGLVAERRSWLGTTDLLTKEPDREELALAFVVRGLIQTRSFADREEELGTGLVQRLAAAASSVPYRRFQPASWQCVVAILEAIPRVCDACPFKPGQQSCTGCGGTGKIPSGSGNDVTSCRGCTGSGFVKCERCDGDRRIQRVTVRTYEDHVAELEHVFVPLVPPALHDRLSARLLGFDELPTLLAVDLDRPTTVPLGSYRTGNSVSPPRFHGIEAAAPFVEAKATLARLSSHGTLMERAVQAHAVPLLTAWYGQTCVAIASYGESLEAFVAEGED